MASQKNTPLKGTDFDSDELYIEELKAVFLKNITSEVNSNPASSIKEGQNENIFTPLESNTKYCTITLPAGDNYCTGFKYFREINRGFVCVWNSGGNHLVYQLNARTGICQQLMVSPCFNFQLNPLYFIGETRMAIQTTRRFNKVTNLQETVIFLVLVDDYNPQRMLCVDDIIATNGFDKNLFPYFRVNDPQCLDCNYINLGLVPNTDCLLVEAVPRNLTDPIEMLKLNKLNYKTWEFRVMPIDVWGRPADHGPISTKYINVVGGTCTQESSGLSRCLKLTFDAGCPFINKWQIEYRNCSGNIRGLSVESDWMLYETIDKYDNSGRKNWWERPYNTTGDSFTYDPLTNTIVYIFCADKECQPLPVAETNKTTNFLAMTSGGVIALGRNIALSKNVRGFEKLDSFELAKMNFTIERPAVPDPSCTKVLRKITVWGVIWNPFEEVAAVIRPKDDNIVFGVADCSTNSNNPYTFDQVLPKKQEGIIAYLAGTSNFAISTQYRYDRNTDQTLFVGLDVGSLFHTVRYFAVQKWEFNVLPGRYVFRIASHKSAPSDDFQRTSTYTIGRTSIHSPGNLLEETKEIVIDVCDADAEILDEPIMIWDLTRVGKGCLVTDATSVNAGYLYEDQVSRTPIALAYVKNEYDAFPLRNQLYRTNYTDHNGFYFAADINRHLVTILYGKKNCVNNTELARSSKSRDSAGNRYKYDELYAYKGTDRYLPMDRTIIKGKITLCDNPAIGVAGALVILTREGYAITDADGVFTIAAHDIGNATYRADQLIYSQRGTCQLLACGVVCTNCFANVPVIMGPCTGFDRVITVPPLFVRIDGYNKKGPHMDGRYFVGIALHDWLDRQSFVQRLPKHVLDIPSLQETQTYDYSKIFYDLTGMVFPDGIVKVSFYITDNLNEDDYLTWVAERIQFVDNTGKVNNAAPTKIRLYYQGLDEYNKQNDYSTNSVWDFISAKADANGVSLGDVVTGDEVEFKANGDGTIYTTRITELVTYDKMGSYIQIAYRDDLKDLKDGALIKLIRQKQCEQEEFYYELCPIITIGADHKAVVPTGELQFFDSYLLNRQIPIPIVTTTTVTDANNNEIVTSVSDNVLRNFPFLFEHHSPSDLWGDHCGTKGRVNVPNPFEAQQSRYLEISMSRALTDDGILNGLHRYVETDAVEISPEYSSITACITGLNIIMVICTNNTLLVPFNDTNVQADAQGRIFQPTLDDKFGNPTRRSEYGCQDADINTIRAKRGIVMFLDTNSAGLIKHTFTADRNPAADAIDVSYMGAKSEIASLIKYNALASGRYFHGVIDFKNNFYLLTVATLKGLSSDYQNSNDELSESVNETLVFDIEKNIFRGTRSYTPEYYGAMEGERNDQQLFSFRFGEAWMHNIINNPNPLYCNFFGVQCFPVIELVFNLDSTKVKAFEALEVYCKQVLLYADRVITETGQISRIMPLWWEKRDKFWVADFKCDVNTVPDINLPLETGDNSLLDGDSLYGRWVRVRFRPRVADWARYFELTAIICYFNGREKSGQK